MFGIGLAGVATVWVGLIMAYIIETISNNSQDKKQGKTNAWIILLAIVTIIAFNNIVIGGFLYFGLFWAYVIHMEK